MTGADRQWAAQYEPGDVVRYTKGSSATGIEAGEYATVESSDRERNLLTVERENGEQLSYDPRRLQGVTVYRESERSFSEGDRVQFTAPDKERHIANRELGTIEHIDERGNAEIRLDSGGQARVRARRASASRLRLRGHQPQQPGRDGRPGADPRGQRAGGRAAHQQPSGVRGRFARPLRCADLHQRCRQSRKASSAARCRTPRRSNGTTMPANQRRRVKRTRRRGARTQPGSGRKPRAGPGDGDGVNKRLSGCR